MAIAGALLFTTLVLLSCADDGASSFDDGGSDDPTPVLEPASLADVPADRRLVQSLNGVWEVESGQAGDAPPAVFEHVAPVPALLSAADPPFALLGLPSGPHEAFWYRTSFTAPQQGRAAILTIHKAKYGLKSWLNGTLLGEHAGVFSRAAFDVRDAILWEQSNTLLVRVGAHPSSLAPGEPAGQDFEKYFWYPGIWDDVNLVVSDSPHIVLTKIEPDIDAGRAVVLTTVANARDASSAVLLRSRAHAWSGGRPACDPAVTALNLAPGEVRTIRQTLRIDSPVLWSPEHPFLYEARTSVLENGVVLDNLETRFGMRKVKWRSGPDKGFYLNNERYYLRGSNITLHRFFDDPKAGVLPWDEDWVRRLLSTWPKDLAWNSFRFSVGRAPNFWYDLADEIGFLLADEFMMWSSASTENRSWSVEAMGREFGSWIRENWNHPSIAWWDASNETYDLKSTQTIERVRHLDATRQWENGGYRPAHGPHDPIEDHPYLFQFFNRSFSLPELEANDGHAPQGTHSYVSPDNAYVINEYGWLWIDREGQPTYLSRWVYRDMMGPGPHDPEEYREAYAYLVAGLTAFWRAHRAFAGVLHFTYLGYSRPMGATCDNFLDVQNLVLEPRWFEYARNAFAPMMIYIDAWAESYPPWMTAIPLVVINDWPEPQTGLVCLFAVGADGEVLSQSPAQTVTLQANGAVSLEAGLVMPSEEPYVLFAGLVPSDPAQPTVWDRRKIGFAHVGRPGPDPPAW